MNDPYPAEVREDTSPARVAIWLKRAGRVFLILALLLLLRLFVMRAGALRAGWRDSRNA